MKGQRHSLKPRRPAVGISACLLGQAVRYDGGHKRNALIVDRLSRHFRLVAFCPEVAIGLGTPRPPIQLVESAHQHPRALGGADPGWEVTEPLRNEARRVMAQRPELCGYIFKSRSPSCAVGSAPLHSVDGQVLGLVDGIYAGEIRKHWPGLPMAEESDLDDRDDRRCFLLQVRAYCDWQMLRRQGRDVMEFHQHYRPLLRHHAPRHVAKLDHLIRQARQDAQNYLRALMQAFAT